MRSSTILNFFKYLLPIGVLIYSTWCGLGFTYDSYDYLAAARSFADQRSLINADGTPYIIHAPFFPVWISWIGSNSLNVLKIIHIVFFIGSLYMVDKIIKLTITNHMIQLVTFLAISMGVGVHMAHNFIWTEPTFLLIFLIHNYCLILLIKSYRLSTLLILIISGFLLGITRNAGLFLIIPTGIGLFLYSRTNHLKSVVLYLVLAHAGFAIWNIYALGILNQLNTFRDGGSLYQDIFASIWVYPDVMSKWFLPPFIPSFLRIVILGVGLIVVVILLKKYPTNPMPRVFLMQFFVYLVCITPIIVVDNSEGERLLSIVYPFFMVSLFMILDSIWPGINRSFKLTIYISCVIWIGYISTRTIKNSIMWHKNGCRVEIQDPGRD